MLVVELPYLPRVSSLEGPIFESVVFCRFVSLTGKKRELQQSQRQVLSMFNRNRQRAISKYFAKACERGFLIRTSRTTGVDPDVYIRGAFFQQDNAETRAFITLANSLWGSKGLLREWPYPAVWGHGCMPPGAVLCLSVLSVLEESISRKSLRSYLSTLVPESSFSAALRYLREHHLIFEEAGRVSTVSDWNKKVQQILECNPACNQRLTKGNERRRVESEANRVRVSRGRLSSSEHDELVLLPCVIKGCKNKRHQEEHFPPWHFLQYLEGRTNRQFVWSICRLHNKKTSAFIRKLDGRTTIQPNLLELAPGNDPMRVYYAAANRWILKFYKAHGAGDTQAATRAVRAVLGLWKALDQLPEEYEVVPHKLSKRTRQSVGKSAYSPECSQLPYRASP
jgi:hypothetical protein